MPSRTSSLVVLLQALFVVLCCASLITGVTASPSLGDLKKLSHDDRLKNIQAIKDDIAKLQSGKSLGDFSTGDDDGVTTVPNEESKEQAVRDFLANSGGDQDRIETLEKRIVSLESGHKHDKSIAAKKRALHERIEAIEAMSRVAKENKALQANKQLSTLRALEKVDDKDLLSHEETQAAQRRHQLETLHIKAPLVRARYNTALRDYFIIRNNVNDLKRRKVRLENLDRRFTTRIDRLKSRVAAHLKKAKFARTMRDKQLHRVTQAKLKSRTANDKESALESTEGIDRKTSEDDKIDEHTDRMKSADDLKAADSDEKKAKNIANHAQQAKVSIKNALAKLAALKKAAALANKKASDANTEATRADNEANAKRDEANAMRVKASREEHKANAHAALMELAESSMERYQEKGEHLKQASADFKQLAQEMATEYKNALSIEDKAQAKAKKALAEEGVAYKEAQRAKRTAEKFQSREKVLVADAQLEIDRADRGKKVADWAKRAFEQAQELSADMKRAAGRARTKEEQDMAAAQDSRKAASEALSEFQKYQDKQQDAANGANTDFVGALSSKVMGDAKGMVIKGVNTAFQITDTIAHVLRFVAEALNMVSKVAPPPAQPPLIAAYKIADKIAKKIRKWADHIAKNAGKVNGEEGKSGNNKAKNLQGSKTDVNKSGNDRKEMVAGRDNALKQTIKADIDAMHETFSKVQAEKAAEKETMEEAVAEEKHQEEEKEEDRVKELKETADKEKLKADKAQEDSEKAQDVAADAESLVKVKNEEVEDSRRDAMEETHNAKMLQQKQADLLRKAAVALREAKKWFTKMGDYKEKVTSEKNLEKEHLDKFIKLRKQANQLLKARMAEARLALKKHTLLRRFRLKSEEDGNKAIGAQGLVSANQQAELDNAQRAAALEREAKDLRMKAAQLAKQADDADADARKAQENLAAAEEQVDQLMVTRTEQDKIAHEAARKAREYDEQATESDQAAATATGELVAVQKKKAKNDIELRGVTDKLEDEEDKLTSAANTRDQVKDELEDVEERRKALRERCKTEDCQ